MGGFQQPVEERLPSAQATSSGASKQVKVVDAPLCAVPFELGPIEKQTLPLPSFAFWSLDTHTHNTRGRDTGAWPFLRRGANGARQRS